nr:ABC transporter permease [Roseococcus suduntuyensis]
MRALTPWLWLAPALLVLVPFFALPLGLLLRNSLGRDEPSGGVEPVFTLENYGSVLTDPFYATVFLNTAGMAAGVGLAALVVGFPYAYAVVRCSARWRGVLLWAVYTPLLVSVIVRVLGWIAITADGGLINAALLATGLSSRPLRILYEVEGMGVGMLHRYLPLMVLPLVNALQRVPWDLLRASSSLGAGPGEGILRIILPLSLPGAVIGFQLVFASVLSDYVLPTLMGTTRFRMLAPALYDEAVTNLATATAAAMAVCALLLVVLMLGLGNLAVRRLAPWARTL